jgi:hypothetical protein
MVLPFVSTCTEPFRVTELEEIVGEISDSSDGSKNFKDKSLFHISTRTNSIPFSKTNHSINKSNTHIQN